MTAEVGAALSALAALKELAAGLVGERDRQKAAAIELEFTNKLMQAHAQFAQLLGTVIDQQRRIHTLEQSLRDMQAAQAEKERYVLAKVGSVGEFFAYRPRPDAEFEQGSGEVAHFVCQPCFETGKKVVLMGNGEGFWRCPVCGCGAQTEPREAIAVRRRPSLTDGFL